MAENIEPIWRVGGHNQTAPCNARIDEGIAADNPSRLRTLPVLAQSDIQPSIAGSLSLGSCD